MSGAPWPSDYQGVDAWLYDRKVDNLDYSICFALTGGVVESIYVGVATYDGTPPGVEDVHFTTTALAAQGLTRAGGEFDDMCHELREGRVEVVQRAVAAGKHPRVSLICALQGKWPLDKLDVLFRLGADPKEIDVSITPLGVLVERACGRELDDAQAAKAVAVLTRAGADPNYDYDPGTALHYAALRIEACPLTYRALVAGGGDPNQPNGSNITPNQILENERKNAAQQKHR